MAVTNIVPHQSVLLPLSSAEALRIFTGGEDPLSSVSAGTGLPATAEIA